MEPLHGGVDDFAGVFRSLLGEMKIDHGGFKACMSHISLDDSGIDAGFQKVGGIAMAKAVNGYSPLGNAGGELGPSKGPLRTVKSHMRFGGWSFIPSSTQGREDEDGISVSYPIPAEQLIGVLRKGNIAILCSLATVDMDHHAFAVYVGYLQGEGFGNP